MRPQNPHQGRKHRAAQRTDCAANPHHRPHRVGSKHVRGCREQVRRPALMRGRGHAQQPNRLPQQMHKRNQNHRHRANGADQHRSSPGRTQQHAAPNEVPRQPAPADAAHRRARIHNDQRWPQLAHIHREALVEKFRQPEQIEPPHGIRARLRERKGPGRARAQQFSVRPPPHHRCSRRSRNRRSRGSILPLQPVVGEQQPAHQPCQAQPARREKRRLPSIPHGHQRNDEWSQQRRRARARIENAGGQRSFLRRKPVRRGLQRRRHVARLAQPQRKSRRSEANHRPCKRVADRRSRPHPDRQRQPPPRPDAVDHPTCERIPQAIREDEARHDVAVVPVVQRQIGVAPQQVPQNRLHQPQRRAIHVVHCRDQE